MKTNNIHTQGRERRACMTATDRLILLVLAAHPEGQRVEYIASATGSNFRWVENETTKMTRLGVLRRVAPGTYAIGNDSEVKK